MASRIPDLLQSATAAVTAARHDLAEVERHRSAALDEQIDVAASLSRSKQLSAELSSVAGDALRHQRDKADALRAGIDERRDLLDRISADLKDLLPGRAGR
jgi:hypothetical protein